MSEPVRSRDASPAAAELRSALRRKLLSIVELSPEPVPEAAGLGTWLGHRESHGCALLLDAGSESLNVEAFVTHMRARYPKLRVVVLESNDAPRNLPCEFGDGAPHWLVARKSSIGRALSVSRWNALRVLSPDRVGAAGDNEGRAASGEDLVCPSRDGRD